MYAPAILLAFVLDLLLGDPAGAWHPVRLIGKAVSVGEEIIRFYFKKSLFLGGLLMALALPFAVWDAAFLLMQSIANLEQAWPPLNGLSFVVSGVLIYFC